MSDPITPSAESLLAAALAYDRTVHYTLLNDPPLRHASKLHSTYANDADCYGDLCDLLTRGRLEGYIPLKPVAAQYCIPLTVGRGYASLAPRHAMAERYRKSGKQKLILLMASDFDPDGEDISPSFARLMRDDFDLDVHPIKVAITAEQVKRFNLPPVMEAKKPHRTMTSLWPSTASTYGKSRPCHRKFCKPSCARR